MASVTCGALAVRALQNAGVSTAFGINGGYSDPICQGTPDTRFRIVDVRHESVANARLAGG